MLFRDLPPVKHHIVEQHILDNVILIKSDKLHARMIFDDIGLPVGTVLEAGQGRVDGGRNSSDIPEDHIFNVPALFRLCPPRCPDPAGDETTRFLDTDVLEGDIADDSIIAVVDTERRFTPDIVDDIAVLEEDIAHIFPQFGTDAQAMGKLVP